MVKEIADMAKRDHKYLKSVDLNSKGNQLMTATNRVLKDCEQAVQKYIDPFQEFMDSPSYTDLFLDAKADQHGKSKKVRLKIMLDLCHDFYYKAMDQPEKMYEQSIG